MVGGAVGSVGGGVVWRMVGIVGLVEGSPRRMADIVDLERSMIGPLIAIKKESPRTVAWDSGFVYSQHWWAGSLSLKVRTSGLWSGAMFRSAIWSWMELQWFLR